MTDSGPLLWEYLGDVLEISRKTGWKTGLKYDLGYDLKSGLKYDLKITCTVSLYPDRSFRETKKLPAASVSATGRKLPAVRFACYVMIVCTDIFMTSRSGWKDQFRISFEDPVQVHLIAEPDIG